MQLCHTPRWVRHIQGNKHNPIFLLLHGTHVGITLLKVFWDTNTYFWDTNTYCTFLLESMLLISIEEAWSPTFSNGSRMVFNVKLLIAPRVLSFSFLLSCSNFLSECIKVKRAVKCVCVILLVWITLISEHAKYLRRDEPDINSCYP